MGNFPLGWNGLRSNQFFLAFITPIFFVTASKVCFVTLAIFVEIMKSIFRPYDSEHSVYWTTILIVRRVYTFNTCNCYLHFFLLILFCFLGGHKVWHLGKWNSKFICHTKHCCLFSQSVVVLACIHTLKEYCLCLCVHYVNFRLHLSIDNTQR